MLDVGSRRVVGFAMDGHHDAELAHAALAMAVAVRGGKDAIAGVIMHTDQGSEGGFNRWSQHLLIPEVFDDGDGGLEQEDQRCAEGCASAVACRSGAAAADALARAA